MFATVRGGESVTRGELRIFSPLLCRLSYPAVIDVELRGAVKFSLCSNVIVQQGCVEFTSEPAVMLSGALQDNAKHEPGFPTSRHIAVPGIS